MAGIAQPALKRLRRDVRARALEDSAAERSASRAARARAPEDAAAERGARRVAHHGDGRNVPDTAGARDYDEAPDAEATTRGRLTLGAGYWVIRRRPGESIEGILRVGDIEWIVPPRHPVPEQHPVTGVKEHELEPIMEPGPATDGLPSPTAPLMLRVEDRVRVRHRGIADADERAGAGALGAALDIFLVQPRENGIPPSTLHTIRVAGLRYWIDALQFWIASRLDRAVDIPGSWSWESVMGQPAHGSGGICALCAFARGIA